jgi:hypothetical protein
VTVEWKVARTHDDTVAQVLSFGAATACRPCTAKTTPTTGPEVAEGADGLLLENVGGSARALFELSRGPDFARALIDGGHGRDRKDWGHTPVVEPSGPAFRRARRYVTFPVVTIESVIPLGRRTLGGLNDNNYPFSSGRTPGQPDDNKFILIRLDAPLPTDGHERDDRDDDDWRGDARR